MSDKTKEPDREVCPKEKANILSIITFFYTLETFKKGFKADLKEEDIYYVYRKLDSETLANRLDQLTPKRSQKTGLVSIIKILLMCFYRELLFLTFLDMTYKIVLSNITTLAVSKLVNYFTPGSTMMAGKAYYYAGTIVAFKLFDVFYIHNFLFSFREFALKIKTAFISHIYRKCLKLSPESLSNHRAGNIVTLITKDVTYVHDFTLSYSNVFTETVQNIVIVYNLHNAVGAAAFAGVGILLLIIPVYLYLERILKKTRENLCKNSDHRLQTTKETLSFIKVIKMYTWELTLADKISKIRKKEVVKLRHVLYLQGLIYTSGFLISQIALYAVLTISTSYKETTAEDVSYIVASFTFLEYSFHRCFPILAINCAEMLAGMKRIFSLLDSEELPKQNSHQIDDRTLIDVNNATVMIAGQIVLNQISCTLSPGLNVITGHLGSGKTTLLKTILKEYPLSEGILQVEGSVSYAGQEPWLFPGTVKKNIVFDGEFDEGRYRQVLSVCALNYDLDLLTDGDQTIVEDNGSNLSKGQQARINLARAIYRESNIYLLDDCLAALDVRVQDHIFQRCFKEFLRGKICVFVTQNPTHIKEAEQLVTVNGGAIISDEALSRTIHDKLQELTDTGRDSIAILKQTAEESNIEALVNNSHEHSKLINEKNKNNLYSEINKTGKVDFSVHNRYINFGGGLFTFLLIISVILGDQFVGSYREKTLSRWVNFMAEKAKLKYRNISNGTEFEEMVRLQNQSFFTYSIILCINVVTAILKTCCFSYYVSRISDKIHKSMIKNVVTATMEFFDKNHLSNILNRFSTDLSTLDDKLTLTLMEFVKILGDTCATFILIATVNPIYLIPSAIITVLLLILRWLYMPTGLNLKSLGNATCSSLVGHINCTLSGMTTIRTFNKEQQMASKFDEHLNHNTSALHMSLMTQFAFSAYIDLLSFFFICYIIIDLLFFNISHAGDVEMILDKSLKLSLNFEEGVMVWVFLETLLTVVERVLEYTDVERENQTGREIKNWPCNGSLEYDQVSFSYPKSKDSTLRNVSLKVEQRAKIGIVGRTGAGKTSLINILFRLYKVDGKILIDNEDCKTIALHSLRSQISIIPQDSILFGGTVRDNVDPKSEFTDSNIWHALEKVRLAGLIPNLGSLIGERRLELSSGQKQLFSIARALLRKNRIVVLDEPTTNLDPETDRLINEIIGTEFSGCTILNVAHKLDSVLGCDKILVMEKGEILEFDTTQTLLKNPESEFYKMVHFQ